MAKLKDLINVFESKEMYETLINIMKRYPTEFVIQGFITLLPERLNDGQEYRSSILKCIGLMINCDQGQEMADKRNLVLDLVCLLLNENDEEIITNTILALKNCLISSKSKWQCKELWHKMCLVLISKMFTKTNMLMQMYSIQALRILSDMPTVKEFLNKRCKEKLKKVTCLSHEVEFLKTDLMMWLKYKNYKESDTTEHQRAEINALPFEYLDK